jgi:hypothetical protein
MACVVLWEAFGPVLAGHDASSASVGIVADNMLRWRIGAPVWLYTDERPTAEHYYCHHPFGIFWITAALRALVGRHDVVTRLAPMVLSTVTPALIAALGRALWGPMAGAIAALGFVSVPIALCFAQLNGLEVPLIFFSTLLSWGWVRHWQCGRPRYLVVALVGALGATNADWPGFVLVACLLAIELGRIVARRGDAAPRFVALAALALTVGGGYLALFDHFGKLDDLLAAGRQRSSGAGAPLAEVLASRRLWIELAFTPLVVALGKLAAVASLARAAWLRRADELVPLAVLAMAAFQYLVFRQGADVHFFWPHTFALHAALGLGALAATVRPALRAVGGPLRAHASGAAVLGLFALALAPVLRDACLALGWARRTGGRFDEKGHFVLDDADRTAALRELATRLPREARVALHESTSPTWAQVWALGGRTVLVPGSYVDAEPDATIVDLRFVRRDELGATLRRGGVEVAWPLALVREDTPRGLGEVRRFDEREPSLAGWLFVSAHEPERVAVLDPHLRWWIGSELGLGAELPRDAPTTLEQHRIARSIALLRGDEAAAERELDALRAGIVPFEARFDGGTELLGYTLVPGGAARATLYLRAGSEPLPPGVRPRVRSFVEQRAALSLTMADPKPREVAPPGFPTPDRWRPGHVYTVDFDLLERPGVERFELSLSDPRGLERRLPAAGGEAVVLFRY